MALKEKFWYIETTYCGTNTGYTYGCRCEYCKLARREYLAEYRSVLLQRKKYGNKNSS